MISLEMTKGFGVVVILITRFVGRRARGHRVWQAAMFLAGLNHAALLCLHNYPTRSVRYKGDPITYNQDNSVTGMGNLLPKEHFLCRKLTAECL